MEHVEKQGVGSTSPDVLRLLQEVVASAPRMPAVQFDQMFNSQASAAQRGGGADAAGPSASAPARWPRPAQHAARAGSPPPRLVVTPSPPPTLRCLPRHQVQDMLVVVYLANLTRTQLALAEKLQSVALSGAGSA